MDTDRIKYTVSTENGDIDVYAELDGIPVGYALSTRDGDRLNLRDVKVHEAFPGKSTMLLRILSPLLGKPRPVPARRRGVGTALLRRLLGEADAAGVHEVWGSVTKGDLQGTPGLLDWYGRFGFVVTNPDGKCLDGAVKKIVRRR